jgi:N12 class adenine-specific DNA methylase
MQLAVAMSQKDKDIFDALKDEEEKIKEIAETEEEPTVEKVLELYSKWASRVD